MNISDSDIATLVTASCGQLTPDQARDHLIAQRTAAIAKRDGPAPETGAKMKSETGKVKADPDPAPAPEAGAKVKSETGKVKADPVAAPSEAPQASA